jgi:hypothetical protein
LFGDKLPPSATREGAFLCDGCVTLWFLHADSIIKPERRQKWDGNLFPKEKETRMKQLSKRLGRSSVVLCCALAMQAGTIATFVAIEAAR